MSASSNPLPPLNKICLIQWAFLIDTVIKWAFLLVACPLPFELDSSYLIGCFKQNLGGGAQESPQRSPGVTTGVTPRVNPGVTTGDTPGVTPGAHHGGESPRGGDGCGTPQELMWITPGVTTGVTPAVNPGVTTGGGKPPW